MGIENTRGQTEEVKWRKGKEQLMGIKLELGARNSGLLPHNAETHGNYYVVYISQTAENCFE